MKTKVCSKCKIEKDISKFYFRKDAQKYRNECKECHNKRIKEYSTKNKEKIKEYNKKYYQENKEELCKKVNSYRLKNEEKIIKKKKKYYQDNKEKISIKQKQYRKEHKEKIIKKKKKYYQDNKEKISIKQKQYRKEHKEELSEYNKKYRQKNKERINENKRKNLKEYRKNPKNRLNHNISGLILHSLKGNKNGNHWEDIVDYTLNELIEHLENISNFTIQDYLEQDLHIDHIIPVSLYKFNSYEDPEFKKCWNYRNLRIIPALENLNKSNDLDIELVEQYEIQDLLPKN